MIKIVALLGFLGAFTAAYGSPCVSGDIASYAALGSSGCTIGALTVSDFSLFEESPSGQASNFIISPSDAGVGVNLAYTPGSTTGVVDYGIQYTFDPPPAIGSASLSMDVEGNVNVTEGICPGGNFTSDPLNTAGCLIGNLDPTPVILTVSFPNGNLQDSATFSPVTNGQVRLIVHMDGTPTDPAGFEGIDATLSNSPEPATFVLLLGGLIAVGVYKRAAFKARPLQ